MLSSPRAGKLAVLELELDALLVTVRQLQSVLCAVRARASALDTVDTVATAATDATDVNSARDSAAAAETTGLRK